MVWEALFFPAQNGGKRSSTHLVGGLNPVEKNISQIGSFPQVGVKNVKDKKN